MSTAVGYLHFHRTPPGNYDDGFDYSFARWGGPGYIVGMTKPHKRFRLVL